MNKGYDFRIKLSKHSVSCEYDTPDRPRLAVNGDLQLEPYLETTELLEKWLKRWERIASVEGGRLLVLDTVDILGDHLWKLALANPVGDRLIDAYKAVEYSYKTGEYDDDELAPPPIRIRISVDDDASDLATLPWEFIRFPGQPDLGPFHLAAVKEVVLSRYLSEAAQREIRRADTKVRVLFIMSFPNTRNTEDEQKRFRWMIDGLTQNGGESLDIHQLDQWDPSSVARKFADLKRNGQPIDVLHLVAMCRDEKNGPQLLLPTYGGADRFQDPAPIVRALTEDRLTRPEVVVLHLGDWSGEDVSEHLERLAPAFSRAGVPAVLAMQYPMTPLEGSEGPQFVPNFYDKLLKGLRIGQAVQAARHDLIFGAPANRRFGAPVLYMQSVQDGPLIQPADGAGSGPDEGWANKSTKAGPLSQRQSANAVTDIRRQLLDWAAELSPELSVANETNYWIEAQRWPDDLGLVWRALKAKGRSEDDIAIKRVYLDLMQKVSTMDAERGNQ